MINRRLKLILWDVDGTIFNSDEIYFKILKNEIKKKNLNLTPHFYATHGLDDCIFHMGLSTEEIAEIKKNINCEYYSDNILSRLKFKKNAKKTIESLSKKYKLSIASGEKKPQIERYLDFMGINNLFGFIGHGQMVQGRKGNEEYYNLILDHFGFSKEECILIGDSLFDAQALRFGIITVIVPTVFTQHQRFPDECLILKNIGELENLVG